MQKVKLIPTDENSQYYQQHIAGRHGSSSTSIGSKLLKDIPDSYMLNLLKQTDKAYQSAIDEKGTPGRMVFAITSDKPIGTNALFPKDNIDEKYIFSTTRDIGTRNEARVQVALVAEDQMPKTNVAHVIMGHYGPTGNAGIYTMICGDEGMPMPKQVDENTPQDAIKFNDKCKEYWDNHVFLITPKELEANIAELKANGAPTKIQELALKSFRNRGETSPITKPYQAEVSPNATKLQLSQSIHLDKNRSI